MRKHQCQGAQSDLYAQTATISRCEDGKTWTNVISFPYSIRQIGFSPSCDLGVAIGVTKMNPIPEFQELAINMSTDKGKNWTNLSTDVQVIPLAISVPSANVAYLLCSNKILKFIP
jgi:hypothetical protein